MSDSIIKNLECAIYNDNDDESKKIFRIKGKFCSK